MKYLGVDYGTKKVGLALSDEGGSVAFPHSVIPNTSALHDNINDILEREHITAVIVGHSVGHDGTENPVMKDIHAFKEALATRGVDVRFEPEFFTTAQAKRHTSDTLADASAAALILQSFLDRKTS